MGYEPREVVASLLESGLTVTEYSESSGVPDTCVYRAMRWCRENDLSVFGPAASVFEGGVPAGPWFDRVRSAYAGSGEAATAATAPAFERIGRSQAPAGRGPSAKPAAATGAAIVVEIGRARVTLPAGAAEADVSAAVRAVALAVGAAS